MKYNIEGGVNFYDELNKSLKDDKDDKDEMMECLITCMPLTENHVTLECNHKFNYIALYKEIVKQKLVYKTYSQHTLNAKDMQKIREVKLDYFIRCPYCRNIQFDILPYYPEMTLPERYGINSTDINLINLEQCKSKYYYGHDDFTFIMFGVEFKKGQCCKVIGNSMEINDIVCCHQYVSKISGTELLYCRNHYKKGLKEHLLEVKTQQKEADMKLKQEKKQEKKEADLKLKQEKKEAELEAKNIIRIANGKKPLILRKKKTISSVNNE